MVLRLVLLVQYYFGQATVDAKLVSPILILIVAITGISSFATPNYSLALSFRLIRFGYILLASIGGFLGILFGVIIHFILLTTVYTFGIPYFVSYNKYEVKPFRDGIFLSPPCLNSFRPPFLNQLDKIKSPKISRKWDKRKEV